MLDIAVLVGAFSVILVGAELFTNGIEWFGHKLELAEGAVGSVLAAVGTALPETMIPLIAILGGSSEGASHVGVGAILGAPFMLATLAMFVTGLAVVLLARRRATGEGMVVDTGVLGTDIRFFAVGYALAIAAAFLPQEPHWTRWAVALVLLGLYAVYVRSHFVTEAAEEAADDAAEAAEPDLAPLRLHRLDRRAPAELRVPRLRIVTFQVALSLVAIVLGANLFVGAVEDLAHSLAVDPTVLALVIAPIATELPEKLNSVIWVRQGKDTLAMGNITGAMVFQSVFPTSIGLLFAPAAWAIGPSSLLPFLSAAITFAAAAAVFGPMALRGRLGGRSLLVGGAFYIGYLGLVAADLAGVIG
ncbi:MAG TPA: hypothetical protein VF763_14470 [Candidatus Limnocylindrales bacterium]